MEGERRVAGLRCELRKAASLGEALSLGWQGHDPKAHGVQQRTDGQITSLLAQSAELAIRHRTESISVELLEQAAASGIYKLPAEGETEEV